MATGVESGSYMLVGKRIKEALSSDANIKLLPSSGSLQNLKLLQSGADLAIVQGGIYEEKDIVALAGLFYEPVLIFYNKKLFAKNPITLLSQLHKKRVSIGLENSSTQLLAQKLLEESGAKVVAFHYAHKIAAQKLQSGEIDAVFVVSQLDAPYLSDYKLSSNIDIMEIAHADAYQKELKFLHKILIPRGFISIERDIPNRAITTLATTATLVAKNTLDTSYVGLILSQLYQALQQHQYWDENFPSTQHLSFPLHRDAEIFIKDGPSIFFKYLPYWTAVWVEKVFKALFPLLIALPMISYAPMVKELLLKYRLSKYYRLLSEIEISGKSDRIIDLENEVSKIKTNSLNFKQVYDLKTHIFLSRSKLRGSSNASNKNER